MKNLLFTILAIFLLAASAVSTSASIGDGIFDDDIADDTFSDVPAADNASDQSNDVPWYQKLWNWIFPQEGDELNSNFNMDPDDIGDHGFDDSIDQDEDELPIEDDDPTNKIDPDKDEDGTPDPTFDEIADEKPPVITLTVSPSTPTLNQVVKIKATASDESGIAFIEIKIDSQSLATAENTAELEKEYKVTEKKTYKAEAIAIDKAENRATQTLEFSVGNSAPSLEITDITVYEGELIQLKPRAYDIEDKNNVLVTFKEAATDTSSPTGKVKIDKQGRWQTRKGDAGLYLVEIRAKDTENAETVKTITIRVIAPRPHNFVIDRVSFNNEAIKGQELYTAVTVRNEDAREEEVELTVAIPELAIKAKAEISELRKGDSEITTLVLHLPDDIEEGEYGVRVEVLNKDFEGELYFTSIEVTS